MIERRQRRRERERKVEGEIYVEREGEIYVERERGRDVKEIER